MDHSKHILGPLCRYGHESMPGSDVSWRSQLKGKQGPCVECQCISRERYRSSVKSKQTRRRYEERPAVVAKRRAYDQLPETKKRRASRQKTEVFLEYQKEYRKTYSEPEGSQEKRRLRMKLPSVKAQQKEYRSTPEAKAKVNERLRHRRATDENFALVRRLRSRLASAFRRHSVGGKMLTSKGYDIDYQAIISHVGPCLGPREKWHLDHIKPISSFNWDDLQTPKKAFAPENHQWLPVDDNLSKGARWAPVEI